MNKIKNVKKLKFQSGQIIEDKDGYHKCICVDDNFAVFAETNKSGTRTKFTKLFAIIPIYYKKGDRYSNGYRFNKKDSYRTWNNGYKFNIPK